MDQNARHWIITKNRIIVAAARLSFHEYVEEVPEIAWDLVEFAEDPLTVIYPKGKNVSQHVLAPDGSIAIRLVKDEFCKGLVYRYQRAIVSTSANLSGEESPKNFISIHESIKNQVDCILQNPKGENKEIKPSKIVKLGLNGDYSMIRK